MDQQLPLLSVRDGLDNHGLQNLRFNLTGDSLTLYEGCVTAAEAEVFIKLVNNR